MPSRDPRSYVKSVPLPIASQKGLKLQARSATVYNPVTPTREEVRKWNYDRRLQQMTEQGFNACSYKPYKGLGDPLYLENKTLILNSLGQLEDKDDLEPSSSSEDEEDPETSAVVAPQTSWAATKFVLKRTRKDLNTLKREVVKGRHLIRNVSLGHGLFDLIKQERQSKKAALFAEKQKSLEEARNQWQPPKLSSDEDESDDDLESHFESSFLDNLSDDFDMAFTSAASTSDYRPKTSSARTDSAGKRKKQVTPRPFTPQYNSILEVDHIEDISRSALFRQLCALNWILDAMNIEQGYTMGPISKCWNHQEIGGSKISAKRAREERRAESDWERWLNNQLFVKVSKKGSITRLNRMSRASRLLSHPRVSLQSRSNSPSSSSSQALSAPQVASVPVPLQASTTVNQVTVNFQKEAPSESRTASPVEADEEEALHRTGIFKFLDEYYDSLRREEEKKEADAKPVDSQNDTQQQEPASEDTRDHNDRSPKKTRNSQDKKQSPDRLSKSPEKKSKSRFILKDLRNSLNRSKSSAELIAFNANKPSNKYVNLRQDLHNKFKEIHDDKAMTLHDVLEQMERMRLAKCQIKYSSLQTSMDFYRAVREMRKQEHRMLTQPQMIGRQSSIRGNWYTDLLVNLPDEVKDIWYYQVIIQKLGRYGLMENTSKQSVYSFLKVLEGLHLWEICHPDISAAAEFCRAKIVEMSIEEYEEWFSQAFPKVLRPKTAPARFMQQDIASKTESKNVNDNEANIKDGGKSGSEFQTVVVHKGTPTKSATSGTRSGGSQRVSIALSTTGRQRW
ncbi:hypothetical protein BsWGS_24145 [Bradybaena similaris]